MTPDRPALLAPTRSPLWMIALAALGLPLGILLALLVPFGEVADESAHLLRAVALMDGQIVGHREAIPFSDGSTRTTAGVTIDPAWERLSRSRPITSAYSPAPTSLDDDAAGKPAFVPLYTIGTYCPVFYVPSAIGLLLGKALGLPDTTAALIGRFANLAAYLLIGLGALALAQRGRILFFCILMLPMSLSLAASFNHDSLIIATTVLAAALLSRRSPCHVGPSRRSLGVAAALIALVLLAKPPYAPLAAMLLVPLPAGRDIGRFLLRRTALAALVVLPGVLWFGYANAVVATPVPRYTYEAGPLWNGARPATFDGTDTRAQAQVLLSEPIRLLTVPAKFLFTVKHMATLAMGAIGFFGWLDKPLPVALYWLWAAGFVLPFAALAGQGEGIRRADLALLAGSALLCVWLVILSQYLSWTNVGEQVVYGPQGRYLLPILPILALAVPRLREASLAGWRRIAVGAPIAAAAVSLVVVSIATARMY